jgi:hypothetical protein
MLFRPSPLFDQSLMISRTYFNGKPPRPVSVPPRKSTSTFQQQTSLYFHSMVLGAFFPKPNKFFSVLGKARISHH